MSVNSQTRQRRRMENSPLSDLNQNITLEIDPNPEEEEDKESLYLRKKNKVSGSFTLISVIVLTTLTLLFVKYMDKRLPEPLKETDVPGNPKSFIEERARRDLHTLTGIGVRVSGSAATDVQTVNEFQNILEKIKQNSSAAYNVEYETQRPTGMFWMADDEGNTASYSKVANVVAKLEPRGWNTNQTGSKAILLNCHFDTKPGSPGATDNMISCSVMLEILRLLSFQEEAEIQNPLVFLFNGAEELGLQGAHGFVRGKEDTYQGLEGHPWSQNLGVFINLEGAGGGGRDILFQATGGGKGNTGWLLKAYKKSPHPYGTVIAEEAFQFGLIPSDTDFRIFRDFKDLPGLDIAFIKNGWVYHTKWDKLSEIPPGSLQHMGDNALAMVKAFGNLNFQEDVDSAKEMVFFDVLGAFMISYSKTVGIIINLLVSVLSVAVIIVNGGWKLKSWLTYAWYIGSTLISWGLAVGVAVLVALFLNGAGYPKPFYSYPSLALVLFGLPALLTQIISYSFCLKGSPEDAWLAGKLTLALLLFVATFLTRAAYIFAIPLIFGIFAWFSTRYLMRGWPRAIMVSYLVVGEIIPLIMSSYLIVTLADVFVPILGRAGSEMNGNLFFGVIIAACVSILTVPGLVPFFVHYDKRVIGTCLFVSVLLLNPMIVFGFLGKIPYQEKTPMRLTICDVERIWYGTDGTNLTTENGYWWWPLDGDTEKLFSEFEKVVKEVGNVREEKLDYANCDDLYCSQPFIWPTTNRIKKVHWIPKTSRLPSHLTDQVKMKVTKTESSEMQQKISLEFEGPPQMTIVISPKRNWAAQLSINVSNELEPIEKEGSNRWKGRNVYYIYHGQGHQTEPLRIEAQLSRIADDSGDDSPLLVIQQSGLYLDLNENTGTPEFVDFLERFPSWTFTGMSWSSVVKMYKIE